MKSSLSFLCSEPHIPIILKRVCKYVRYFHREARKAEGFLLLVEMFREVCKICLGPETLPKCQSREEPKSFDMDEDGKYLGRGLLV